MTKDQRIAELEARLCACREDRDAHKRRIDDLERDLAGERAAGAKEALSERAAARIEPCEQGEVEV